MNQPIPDTIKCVGVRFFANPELEDRTVLETEEMCRKTIGMLEWLNEKRPIIVMMAVQGALSLMAIRTLICRELHLSMEPLFGRRVPEIEQMLNAHPDEPQVIEIKNEFADGSCRFGMGSSMNGNLIMNPKNEQKK